MTKTQRLPWKSSTLAKTMAVIIVLSLIPSAVAGGQNFLSRADAVYGQRADLSKAFQAADLYRQAMAADSHKEEPAWKLARALCWIADRCPKDQQLAVSEEAVAAAKRAVAINPENPHGHFWLGIAYGFYGGAKGIFKSLSLVDPIMNEMEKVIALDPSCEGGGAYMVLGRLNFFKPAFLGGDKEKAVAYLKKAIKYGPRRWINHLYLAEVYMEMGREDEARVLLHEVLSGPAESGLEPEDKEWKGEARHLLSKLN